LDLGNNFIRRGTGLPRTPTKKDSPLDFNYDDEQQIKAKPSSKSPINENEYGNN
jgi:hypothetical protein